MLTTLLLTALLTLEPATKPADAMEEMPQMSPEEMAMMEAYIEAGMPGEKHEMLSPFVGEWETTSIMQMPGQEPMESKGTASSAWVMDGRFVQQTYAGNMMGMAFTGMSMTGYDNVTGKYQSVWVDSMSSGMAIAYGTVSEDGKTFTFEGKYADPMTGKMKPYKQELIVESDDRHVFKMYEAMVPGGEMVHTFTIIYDRV
ncbi:MAG: DUF1579 domain-containing protein [Planctomycetota bacterium]